MADAGAPDRPPRRLPRRRRQAGRAGRPPGALAPAGRRWSTSWARSSAAARPRAARDRPPARQGDQRAAGRRPRRGRPRAPCRRRSGAARSNASTWRSPAAASPSRSGTIDAPIGRASRQRHRMAVSGRRLAPGADPLRGASSCSPRETFARGPPGDRPHPPDPRPLRRHRPPADRRPDLRRRASATASSGRSSTPTASPSRTRSAARG